MFPFFLDTKLIYVKFRKPKPGPKDKKEWQTPNTMPILFGMDMCSFSKPLIITEGQCLTGDAEILTENGWVEFQNYDGFSKVMSVNENMTGEFTVPYAIIKKEYTGDMIATRRKEIIHYPSPNIYKRKVEK